jgi:formylglycine-generating enzyme required for sulfatase activity
MLLIPGGEYFMGSDEKDADAVERPSHKVMLSPYCLDEFEVTVAQYKECSDRGACRRAGKENVWPGITAAQRKIYDPLCNITDPVNKAKHPINCVDWEQAREACEARGGRLPTEAEWEFAARGPDGRIYPWGDEAPSGQLMNGCGKECVAWQKAHPDADYPPAAMYADDDGFANTAPVGSFPKGKSRYGVQDVVGNVWEWVADNYAAYDKALAQTTQADPKGPAAGADRVIRGGAWNAARPSWVRPSFRFHVAPSARSYGFGFRCAKTL